MDILDLIEDEQPSTETKGKGKGGKKTEWKKTEPKPKKTEQVPHLDRLVKVSPKSATKPQELEVPLANIQAISKNIWVNDIHSQAPTEMAVRYIAILRNERHIVVDLTEEVFDFIRQNKKTDVTLNVVDLAVLPGLTYVFENQLKFPTMEQIMERDKSFKDNPTYFHNFPITVKVAEMPEDEPEEEEDFIIDDEEESAEDDDFIIDDEDSDDDHTETLEEADEDEEGEDWE